MGRRGKRSDAVQAAGRAGEDVGRRRSGGETAQHDDPAARERDRREPGGGFWQRPDPLHREDEWLRRRVRRQRPGRARALNRPRQRRAARGQEVHAVGLVEVPRRVRRDVDVTVAPDDAVRPGVDDDHAMAPVVVDRDEPVRKPDRERGTVEAVAPRRGAERPRHAARSRHLHHSPGIQEGADEDPAVRQELRVRRVGDRRSHRPHEPSGAVDPVDPAADLGHEHAAVRKRRVAVRAREPAGRVVDAAPSEHAQHASVVPQLDDPAIADVGHRRHAVREPVCVVGGVEVAVRPPGDSGVPVAPDDTLRPERKLRERVVELLVRDDAAVAGGEEGVVRLPEPRSLPDDAAVRREEDQAVVVPVGDEEIAGEDPRAHRRETERGDEPRLRLRDVLSWRRGDRGVSGRCRLARVCTAAGDDRCADDQGGEAPHAVKACRPCPSRLRRTSPFRGPCR